MSDEAPKRFKDEDELDGDELLQTVQARRRGDDPPQFERKEYRQHKADALREAGLDAEADELETAEAGPVPMEERTTQEHFDRIRRADRAGR
jgi:hypothetical protein